MHRPTRRNDPASTFRNLDWTTVIIYLIMVLAGMVSIYAACYNFDNASMFADTEFSGKQLRWIGLSLALGLVILLIDARMYETYAFPIYIGVVILLAVTPLVAHDIKGSRSWISFGPMSLQPAEFAKFATALALAKLFSTYHFVLNAKPLNYVKALTIIFLPIALILLQNETGSALTFMALFLVLYREGMSGLVLFAAFFAVVIFVVAIKYTETMVMGMPTGEFVVLLMVMVVMVGMGIIYSRRIEVGRNLIAWFAGAGIVEYIVGACGIEVPGLPVALGVIGVACIYVVVEAIKLHKPGLYVTAATAVLSVAFLFSVNMAFDKLQPHQKLRIQVALGIVEDLRAAGYNVNQSKIAIGSGGFFGKGFLNGTQTKLKYVPEQHTDFIFCTIGEEEGFVGAALVTLLFLALILRVIKIGERQPTTFARVYAYCVASYFIFHFCINIGMVIGLCPVIGIPLPFFSYGGSSLWGFTILLFILLKLDAARKNVLSY
ncbi:MAG: rod shape-determining protein RodA [Muribaculaceae bacterium]|nr:rod shape-determining protein RodA [Muribaculaceae bacterium]